jgi:hypothetical protein
MKLLIGTLITALALMTLPINTIAEDAWWKINRGKCAKGDNEACENIRFSMKKILTVLTILTMLLVLTAFCFPVFAQEDQICIADKAAVNKQLVIPESIPYHPFWEIHKFKDPTGEIGKALQKGAPLQQFASAEYAVERFEHNIALREGITELLGLIAGIGSPAAWSNAAAYLGVGTSTTGAAATQTGLIANPVYKAMDSTYPQVVTVGSGSSNALEWRSTFGSSDANQAWEEYSVSNTSSDTGKNLNRYATAKGTKSSGETWTLSLKICFGTECS